MDHALRMATRHNWQTELAAIQAENQRSMIWHLLKLTETSIQRITGTLLDELL